MEERQTSGAPRRRFDQKVYECHHSSKGTSPLLLRDKKVVIPVGQSFRRMEEPCDRIPITTSQAPEPLILFCSVQIIQVPTNGLRNGNLGDDEPPDSAQKGLPLDLLPRTLSLSPYLNHIELKILQKRTALSSFYLHPTTNSSIHRDKEHLASTRPILHLPPLILHASHGHRMGNRLRPVRRRNNHPSPPLRLRPLPRHLIIGRYSGILSRREAARAGNRRVARKAQAAGTLHQTGRG